MNNVYFGYHAYGIEAASQIYFSKPAKDLDLEEAALLAGLPQAPSLYDPLLDPKAAIERRDVVLRGDARQRRDHVYQYAAAIAQTHARTSTRATLYSTIREATSSTT